MKTHGKSKMTCTASRVRANTHPLSTNATDARDARMVRAIGSRVSVDVINDKIAAGSALAPSLGDLTHDDLVAYVEWLARSKGSKP